MNLHTVIYPPSRRNRRRVGMVPTNGRRRLRCGQFDYTRLLSAMQRSVADNSPETPLTIHTERFTPVAIDPAVGVTNPWGPALVNKARTWAKVFRQIPDGAVAGVLDCDVIVLDDLRAVAEQHFDLAITMRPPGSHAEFNLGVMFVRGGVRLRAFADAWASETARLVHDASWFARFQPRFGRLDQAVAGMLLAEQFTDTLHVARLDCRIWNCENTTHHEFGPHTKIVHILEGPVRDCCMGLRQPEHSAERAIRDTFARYDQ